MKRGSTVTWGEHLRQLKDENEKFDNEVQNTTEEEEAVVRLALEREEMLSQRSKEIHMRQSRRQEEEARKKDFALKMLTIHEQPGKDFVTLKSRAKRFVHAVTHIQRWTRGHIVRNMLSGLKRDADIVRDDQAEIEVRRGGGWKEARNEDGLYYWHRTSGLTTFQEPNVYENIHGHIIRRGTYTKYSAGSKWIKATSSEGREYYYDSVTGARSWTPPPGYEFKNEKSRTQRELNDTRTKNLALRKRLRDLRIKVRELESSSDLDLEVLEGQLNGA
jgi:hypothetical protein